MKRIFNEISNKPVLYSQIIIQETESAKCNDPGFDINEMCNETNWTLLMNAVYHGRKEIVEYLLSIPGININHRSVYDSTALHFCDNVSILKLLLSRRDLDVNIQNENGRTGLHYLCYWGHKARVREYLLDARINVLIRDNNGYTARDYALKYRYPDIAKIIGNSRHTTLLRIPNRALLHDVVRMIIEEYM